MRGKTLPESVAVAADFTYESIRLTEELFQQITFLGYLKDMAALYGYDISAPAKDAREAIQWTYFAYLGAIKEQITTHTDALSDYNVSGLQEYGRSSGQHIAYDLGHFVSDLNGGQMPDAFKIQLDKTVLYKGCLDKARPTSYSVDPANYCGLGIYIPVSNRSKWNDYFKGEQVTS